jgi:hypothetical protein
LIGRQATRDLDLEALEMAARYQALQLAARAIERCLNADTSDQAGPHLPCRCGSTARYVDRRRKRFQSVLGELELERAYYHCSGCQQGFFPRDRALGSENTSLSPAVTRMIGAVGALVSFQEGSQLLQELAGLSVEAKQVERVAERLGQAVAQDERGDLQPAEPAPPPTLYLGLDGTGIPMRASELLGRTGKQADGSAKTREVKLCTIWSAESRDSDGLPVRDAGSVTYSAAIESAASPLACRSEFTDRVLREAMRRRFLEAGRTVVIGDGAPWIWNIAQELFPRAIQIVDRYHAKEHLSTVAKAIYGPTHPQAQPWAKRRHAELDDGRFDSLLKALWRHAATCEEARKCCSYLQTNRPRMRYPEFRAQGLCTSSGVVEAGCKTAIGTRLKRAGMHWTLRGSNAIIALRCCRLSGRFEDFWERRSQRKAAA